jgi:hypothetical protein
MDVNVLDKGWILRSWTIEESLEILHRMNPEATLDNRWTWQSWKILKNWTLDETKGVRQWMKMGKWDNTKNLHIKMWRLDKGSIWDNGWIQGSWMIGGKMWQWMNVKELNNLEQMGNRTFLGLNLDNLNLNFC